MAIVENDEDYVDIFFCLVENMNFEMLKLTLSSFSRIYIKVLDYVQGLCISRKLVLIRNIRESVKCATTPMESQITLALQLVT
jgi:hypothetical protein